MNRDDVTRWARDSGMELYGLGKDREKFLFHLECFAQAAYDAGAAAEREACAKVCEEMTLEWEDQPNIAQAELATMMDCALAIRARGERG